MRSIGGGFLGLVLVLLLSLVGRVQGELGIADLPSCGLNCLLITVPAAGCSLLDTACQCASQSLAQSTAGCILANCTMADSLQTARVQASLCHLPNPTRSYDTIVAVSVIYAFAVLSVILRLASKWKGKTYYVDDYLLMATIGFTVLPFYCIIRMSKLGWGTHLWGLKDGHLTKILKIFYIAENAYIVTLMLIKISLVLFYIRIFPQKSFRTPALATLAFILISSTTVLILTIVSCRPISLFWNKDIKNGKCMDVNALAYANAALAIVQDLIILALPLLQLRTLKMRTRKKISVGIMFALGSFGCITTFVRLRSLLVFGNSIDPTWDYVPVVWWTTLELGVGIICACLPSIRKLLKPLFPSLFKSTNQSYNYNNPPVGMGAVSKSSRSQPSTRSWELISDDVAPINTIERDDDGHFGPPPPFENRIMLRNSVTVTHEEAPRRTMVDSPKPKPPPKDNIEHQSSFNQTKALPRRTHLEPESYKRGNNHRTFLSDPSSSSSARTASENSLDLPRGVQ